MWFRLDSENQECEWYLTDVLQELRQDFQY